LIVDQDLIILDEENYVAITEFLSQVVESEPPLMDMSMYLEHRLYIFFIIEEEKPKIRSVRRVVWVEIEKL
jgi:hypothetical protein